MVQAIVLAAGESSRFQPLSERKHKSLLTVMGKTILEHTLHAIQEAGVKEIIVVVSPRDKQYVETLVGSSVTLITQQEAKGMGDALLQCEKQITSQFFVLNADRFDASNILKKMLTVSKETKAEMVVLSTKTNQPWKYGMLTIQNGNALNVTEKPKQGEEPSNDKIVGIYLLPKDFLSYYKQCKEHQYAYEDALSLYMKEHTVPVVSLEKEESSAKYSWDLLDVASALLQQKLKNDLVIDPTATIAKGAVIEGPVFIGKNSKIFEHAVIKGPVWIGENCVVGNNAVVRDTVILENNTSIGMGTEVARSLFLEGSTIHSGYVGDSIVGEHVKIGAGFVTANKRLDRKEIQPLVRGEKIHSKKHALGAIIGHGTKIGIMSSTMPGTIIGCDCIIGSNTHVKGTITSDTIIYSQVEQIIQKRMKE